MPGPTGQAARGLTRPARAQERQLADSLGARFVQKLSMKRWIEERHAFWPSRTATERQMVEAAEDARALRLTLDGWPADPALTKFARANRTSWEQAASAERPAVGPPPPSY